ncbi:MAG: hypothetical protein ACXWNR_07510, partial [Candidatus Limnocylindrales bacterium]
MSAISTAAPRLMTVSSCSQIWPAFDRSISSGRLLAAQDAPLDQASVNAVDLLGIAAMAGTGPLLCRDPGRAAA